MDELENIVSCSICMEIFESPRQLPCQHTYCSECLSDHITKKKKVNGKKNQTFVCPLCRAEVKIDEPPYDVTLFPINLVVQSILDSKELMKTLEENTIFHETKPNQSLMSKMRKYLSAREIATQTENFFSNNEKKTGKPNPFSGRKEGLSTFENDNLNEFIGFSSLQINNIYQPIFRKMFEPLISGRCSSLRRLLTIGLSAIMSLFFILLYIAVLFETEIACFINTLAAFTLIIQLLFVRIKPGFSKLEHRLFVLLGYVVIYIFTFLFIGIIFLFASLTVCHFVAMHNLAFKTVNFTVWTPEGFQIQQRHIYNGHGNVDNSLIKSQSREILDDYVLYLNFHINEFWQEFKESIKYILTIFAVVIFVSNLIAVIINPGILAQFAQPQQIRKQRRRRTNRQN